MITHTFFANLVIQTDRLVLRKPTLGDADTLFRKYTSDPRVTKYTTWKAHETVDETKQFLTDCLIKWERGDEYNFVIETKDNHSIIGMFKIALDMHIAQLGYVIARDNWNKGYATEVALAAINFLFTLPEITSVQAFCDLDNIASEKVMIKSGMKLVKKLPEYILHPTISSLKRDCWLYEITKAAYEKRSAG